MKLTWSSASALTATAAIAISMLAAPAAFAQGGKGGGGNGGGRKGGPAVSTSGVGTLGSSWTLKSAHDDDGPGPVVGEEFEINTPAGHIWKITLSDNGTPFFNQPVTADATGARAMSKATDQGIEQFMSVHAVDQATGEVIDGVVDLPAL